ncbi:MAG: MG2 domain-containing protein [Chitinophagales bacterium]
MNRSLFITRNLILFCIVLSLFSCKNSKNDDRSLEVILTSFKDEIQAKDNLTFTFNHPVLKTDTLLNKWLSANYLSFSPKVEGKYKWINNDEVVFSPADQFQFATDYTVSVTNDILSLNDQYNKWKGKKAFIFNTPYLQLSGIYAVWSLEDNVARTKITGLFNIPVASDQIKDNLNISINGESYPYEVKDNPNSTEHIILLKKDPDPDKQQRIEVELKQIDKKSQSSSKQQTNLIPKSELKIIKIEPIAEGLRSGIKVYSSQQIDAAALKDKLSIEPKIKYEIEPTYYGFFIQSDEIQIGNSYTVKLIEGLTGILDGKLKRNFTQQVSFGNVMPEIAFNDFKSIYLGSQGNKNVSIKIVNTPKVTVSIYKIFENNLLHFLQRGKDWGSYYDYESDTRDYHYYDYRYYETSDVGQLVYEQEMTTDQLPSQGISKLLHIDFEDKLKDKEGIYVIKVQDNEKYYISDSKLISLSDIGLISKEDKNSIYVFTNSIKTAQPKSGTEITLISQHNQVITSQKTGGDGIAKFSKTSFPEGFYPSLIIAKSSDDFNYMDISNAEYMTSRFDVGGKRKGESPYDLFMYAERSLYRPGETIHLAGILRDFNWNVSGKMPVTIVLKSPDGKEYATSRQQVDEQGMFTCDFDLLASSMTGNYYAQVHTGKDIHLGGKSIQVEEFMPDRIKVELDIDKDMYIPGDAVNATLTAMNYFGPPAANKNYEIEYTLDQGYFNPKGFESYHFGLKNDFRSNDEYKEGKTDADGKAETTFELSSKLTNNGMLSGRIYATVFDETGRPVHRAKRFTVQTQDVFVGVGNYDYWTGLNQPVAFPLMAVNTDEKAVTQEVEVEVIQYSWHSVLRYSGGRYAYESQREQIVVKQETITIPSKGSTYYFTPTTSGSYEISVRLPGAESANTNSFYAYGFDNTNNTSFQVDNEGNIDISFDKESYQPGDKGNAILKLPFDGKVLITTERDEIMSYVYMDSKDKVIKYPINVSDKHVPNAYITATLIKPHINNNLPLTVAHGFASFPVEPKKGKLNLSVDATEKSRSKTKQKITINSVPNAHLTVAVVDEGILALGNQQTPDPYAYFYAKRALEVNSSDLYPYLFPEITATGGDADMLAAEMANRQNPLKNKRVKLVSFWSDKLVADKNGKVSFEVDIPQFSGSLRVMAVGCKDQMFGSIDENIVVADPIVVSSGIPRFLSMGDEWTMKVNVSNTTGKAANSKVSVETEGPLTVVENASQNINVPPNSEQEVSFTVKAGNKIDVAKIIARVEALGESFVEETDITIRPAASLEKQYTSGIIEAGETKSIAFPQNFMASSAEHKIFISSSPLAQFTEKFDQLVAYPFGCLEQTVSKAFPQLYFEDLIAAVYNGQDKVVDKNEIKRNVQHAIDKIKTMQLSNGGLSYWPNNGEVNWWSSAYAAHFLIEAKAKGYQVDSKMFNRLMDYLRSKLKQKEKIVYYYNGNEKKTIVSKETAYSLYVLAAAGEPDHSSMKHYLSNVDELSLDAKYLLACAFIMSGDITSSIKLLPGAFQGEQSVPVFGGSFYSYIRDLAVSTNALIEAQPDHPQIPDMVKLLSTEMGNKKYLNTQEAAFGFLALGKYARLRPIGKANADLLKDGKEVAKFTGNDIWYEVNETTEPIDIKVSGEGSIYYFVESKGIPIDGKIVNRDNHLKVRRSYYDRNKRLITNNEFDQNDLIVVKITLQSLTGKYIENVAVTDILPAGFEIENARITEMPDLNWVNTEMSYDHRDIRDDRIHFFTTATGTEKTFYYLARAVTPGKYQLGPVSADAMYNGEFHSYYGSGTVTVK